MALPFFEHIIFWQYEVGNFLGRELGQDAAGKMDFLLNLNIGTVDLNGSIYRRCFAWMQQNEITFYDACYLAVAFEIQACLVTADERFTEKMGKTEHICLLKDLDFGSGGI